jgi:predicted membrane-bound spermidine synthase
MDRSSQPTTKGPDRSGGTPIPPALVQFVGVAIFFEVLAALGVVVRPSPFSGARGAALYLGAGISAIAYLGLTLFWRGQRRLHWSDLYVPGIMLLLAHCSGGFSQLSTVLLPHTLLDVEKPPAFLYVTTGYLGSSHPLGLAGLLVIVISGVWVACILAYVSSDDDHHQARSYLGRLAVATFIGAVLCIAIPLPGPSHSAVPLVRWAPSAAAAAISPARTGAVSFALLWAAIVTFAALQTASGSYQRRSLIAALMVVVVLAWRAEPSPLLSIPLTIVLAAIVHFTMRGSRLHRGQTVPIGPSAARHFTRLDVGIILIFFFSGAAALVYQVVFAKGLALTFGSTSHASTIVLATYMAGLALGSWWGGRLAERVRRPVLFYAGAELGIAFICVVAPLTLKLTRSIYVTVASGADPAQGWLVGLQLALGAFVLMPPTLLMGVTLPMLTRHLIDRRESLGTSAGVLYASNTLGAAVGAIATGYLIMPALGVTSSLRLAVGINVLVAATALLLSRRQSHGTSGAAVAPVAPEVSIEPHSEDFQLDRVLGWIAIVQLTVGGFITFGLETTFVHLLATIAGNSAYAFSLMLFAFLIGLGLGSNVTRRWLRVHRELATALLFCQALLALALLLGVPYWDAIPRYFSSFGAWAPSRSFAARELIRFLACLVVMLPPALFIGAQYPIAMEAIGRAFTQRKIAALGVASALNTVGNILGALVVGFVFLPLLGSLSTLHALTIGCLCLAALSLPYTRAKGRTMATALLAVEALLYLKQPVQFDLSVLASGGNVYFQSQHYGRVIDSAESLDGGLTTVAIAGDETKRPILTLLTNGKFQGDDSTGGEMKAQSSFALAPLLHTQARGGALVIGFGTGTTTKVFHQAGFRRIEVAELSGDILTLADRHFRAVNAGVLHESEVKAHVTDGRNFLLLDQSKYDVVSIELSSIWFAGAANLYNREFYQLVRAKLAPGGVLQQWVQLHRLAEVDIATILTTLAEQFPQVWLYFLGKQGILVACDGQCQPSKQTVAALDQAPALATTLRLFDGHVAEVLKGRMLTPTTLHELVSEAHQRFSVGTNQLIATDDNLTLEYSTPKGNVRPYVESLDQNLRYLEHFKVADVIDSTTLTTSDLSGLTEPATSL